MAPLYIVLIVIVFIWSGIFGYLLHLDKQIRSLRESQKKMAQAGVKFK
jgi:CcmD family protein